MMSHPPVPISELAGHIERLRANSGARFSAEYESIDPGQQLTWDAASQDDNKQKNRYANVIAYDHSRVQLSSLGQCCRSYRIVFMTNNLPQHNYTQLYHSVAVFTCVSYAEARLSYRLDVCLSVRCPSVRLSVTRWYCIKTAEDIVMLSLTHDSPFILVLCISRSSQNSDAVTPCGAD